MKRRLTRDQGSMLLLAGGAAAVGAGLWLAVGLGVALIAVGVLAVGVALLLGMQ
ncbi:hypothetical protein ACQP60_04225 [Isoptericola variabilis]|uniref:hypothetical protein n=1 Tax=Isoptericola variabilis TaxID=139208 RepID=UPI003D224D64